MEPILHDLSPSSLSLAIENNLSSWIPDFGKIWEARWNDPPGVNRSVCSLPIPVFNSIMDARLQAENAHQTIAAIREDAQLRQVPVLWWVGPSSRPPDLGKRLEEQGFVIDDDSPGMAVVLADLKDDLPAMAGLTIQAARSEADRWDWCTAMAIGFEIPSSVLDLVVKSWYELILRADPATTQVYLARWEDKPVATSMLKLGGGVAGIYAVSTVPEARQKGIGARVTLQPLTEAKQMGYTAGILQSSDMGHRVYQSLGFRDYCHITSYVYRPKK